MSLFDKLFRRPPPATADWVAQPGIALVADLDRFALNDVGCGDPVDRLSFLGPSTTPWYDFPHLGFNISVVEDGKIDGYHIALAAGAYLMGTKRDDTQPFRGTIRLGGRDWHPHELSRESYFLDILGEPYWRDVDDEEVLLFYEFSHGELQVELSLDDRAQIINVAPDALMADPEQRDAYGVTKAWPPA